jgi:hypothetical protein
MLWAQSQTDFGIEYDTVPRYASVMSQIRMLPMTSWGSWSTVKSCIPEDLHTVNVCTATQRRAGTISYTKVPMFEDKIYLHFDKLEVMRFPQTEDITEMELWQLSWSSEMTSVVLEVDTSEVSTWALWMKTPEAVTMADWEWPYHTRNWKGVCQDEECSTIIQGKFGPMIQLPTRITELYPQLSGCLRYNRWYGKFSVSHG